MFILYKYQKRRGFMLDRTRLYVLEFWKIKEEIADLT